MSETRKFLDRDKGLLADSALLFFANAGGSALGFAFHLAVARVGGPRVYADLGALISINIMLSIAAFSIQTYVSAAVARRAVDGRNVKGWLGDAITKAAISSFIGALALGVCAVWIARFLNLASVTGVIVLAIGVIPLFTLSVLRGGLAGAQRFQSLSGLRVLEPGVQIIVGTILVALGLGAGGGVVGTVSGITISCLIAWRLLRPKFSESIEDRNDQDPGTGYAMQVLPFVLFVTSFTNFDVFLVKHQLPGEQAAGYVAASFMSRILFLSAVSIGFALFPKTAAGHDQGGRKLALLMRALGYFSAFAVPFVVFVSIFPEWVVRIFYGDAYAATAIILPRMLVAYLLLGLSYLVGSYKLSRMRRFVWLGFAMACAAQVALIHFFPTRPENVALYMIGCSALLTIVTLLPLDGGGDER